MAVVNEEDEDDIQVEIEEYDPVFDNQMEFSPKPLHEIEANLQHLKNDEKEKMLKISCAFQNHSLMIQSLFNDNKASQYLK
jgi:hypothetical protein